MTGTTRTTLRLEPQERLQEGPLQQEPSALRPLPREKKNRTPQSRWLPLPERPYRQPGQLVALVEQGASAERVAPV